MKRFLLLMTIVIANVSLYGKEYLALETAWVTEAWGSHNPQGVTTTVIYKIDGEKIIEGYDSFELSSYSLGGQKLESITYLRQDGDKIYFYFSNTENPKWLLMYDFGLTPGETCHVYQPLYSGKRATYSEGDVTCVKSSKADNDFNGLATLTVQHGYYEVLGPQYGVWIDGIGASGGILRNINFNLEGFSSELMEFIFDKKVIYSKKTGIKEVNVSKHFNAYRLNGEITIYGPAESHFQIYDITGKFLGAFKTDTYGNVTVRADAPQQFYILRDIQTGKTQKIIM